MAVTFDSVLAGYVAASGSRWKASTARTVESVIRSRILPVLGSRDVAAMRRADIEEFLTSCRDSPAQTNRAIAIISGAFRWSERHGLRPENSNPCSGVPRARESARERFLADGEYRTLWRRFDKMQDRYPQQILCFRLLLLTGCRCAEIRCLRWSDYRDGGLHLAQSKTGPRRVWLCPRSRALLDAAPRSCAWVFPSADESGPRHYTWLWEVWQTVCESAEISGLRIHDLRHSYASFALRKGVPVSVIGRLLGHRDIHTTMRYTHWHDTEALAAVSSIGKVLGA